MSDPKDALLNQPVIQHLPFATDRGTGSRARIGLIVLATDLTIEAEFRHLMPQDGVVIHHARLANDSTITTETLAQMEHQLPVAAGLFPAELELASIGYGCTSGAMTIGEQRVAEIIAQSHPGMPSSNPMSAAKAAMRALGMTRIGLVTPYAPDVTETMRASFAAAGFAIAQIGSFYESDDFVVGRIDTNSILQAAIAVGSSPDCDGVFISCTNLQAAEIIPIAEARLNKPVTASNHALAWHLLRLAGINDAIGQSLLFQCALPQTT